MPDHLIWSSIDTGLDYRNMFIFDIIYTWLSNIDLTNIESLITDDCR